MSRARLLKGAPNARDLGGIQTSSGKSLRPGEVIRSEALAHLTDADRKKLGSIGIRAYVDYRGASEIAQGGEDRMDPNLYIHCPVFSLDHDIFMTMTGIFCETPDDQIAQALGDGRAEQIMVDMYTWFVSDPKAREPFGKTLRWLAETDRRPMLYHCTAGKDRTGWMTAILLTVLGVDRETIYADYLASNFFDSRSLAAFLPQGLEIDPAVIAPLLTVRPRYLDAAFSQVENDFGTFDEFVESGLGTSSAHVETLREELLA